ncbi:hypothetical protein Clacol_007608 [Clathrus columnatus]|uniref:UDP-Glycosyltransferase/glycogen phosphorylase n=1 Tax=Clathrus columnatus TaxID=1419009 RepID=A0AAV5ALP3_9AGAM|nr:hypothetical protein Clacol_007608 [Clathrus columnatus]
MTSTPSKTTHVLLVSPPGWGHLRPCIVFACKLARTRPGSIIITIPVVGEYKSLTEKEIDRCLSSEEKSVRENFHVINLGGEGKNFLDLVPIFMGGFGSFYASLHTVVPIKCTTGRIHTFERSPDVVVADVFMLDGLHMIRNLSDRKVPVLCWNPANLGPVMRLVGPEVLGGIGDIEAKAAELAQITGKSHKEAEYEVFHPKKGEVVKGPGMPPMYDYEYYPNALTGEMLELQIPLHKKAFKMLHECDGMICASNTAFEPEAYRATKEWFAETSRPLYVVGPLLPDSILSSELSNGSKIVDPQLSTDEKEIVAFLDNIYATSGSRSLLYVSFGTIFWPPGDGIWRVIDIILSRDIPLLLVYDEPRLGKMPEHIAEKIKKSDRALTSTWMPQQTILCHEATGWFMTHCGQNSVTEAIVQGVPMYSFNYLNDDTELIFPFRIGWPMDAEQPANAAYITLILGIAYELLEGRTGLGLKPMCRGAKPQGTLEALEEEIRVTLDKAFGEDGEAKRENIRILRDKVKAGLKEGGDSAVDFENFVKTYLNV